MKLIREFDDFNWIREIENNPWLEYNGVSFDKVPTREDVDKLIEMALNTRKISNMEAWESGRELDIDEIIMYANYWDESNPASISINEFNQLTYGVNWFNVSPLIPYSKLKTNINESSDGFDWIRDIEPFVTFAEAKNNQRYNLVKTKTLLDTINNCGDEVDKFYNSISVKVNAKKYMDYSDIDCGSKNTKQVLSLLLTFYDKDDKHLGTFWVTEDMLTLYPITDNINESSDGFDWIRDIEPYKVSFPITKKDLPNLIGHRFTFITNYVDINDWKLTSNIWEITDYKGGYVFYKRPNEDTESSYDQNSFLKLVNAIPIPGINTSWPLIDDTTNKPYRYYYYK